MTYISKPKMKKFVIDVNCDLAQSFGVYKNEKEFEIVPYVSTINVSCGAHAGDPLSIMETLSNIEGQSYAISAHIGYPDLQGFGYREMNLSEDQMKSIVLYQLGALSALAKVYSLDIEYVRPHGALYKQAAENYDVSLSIANAIKSYNPWLIYVGATGENLDKVSEETGVRVAHEIMLDKVYDIEGKIDFNAPDIENIHHCMNQLDLVLNRSMVRNSQGGLTKIKCDTIHLSSRSKIALELAKKTDEMLANSVPVAVSKVADSGWV